MYLCIIQYTSTMKTCTIETNSVIIIITKFTRNYLNLFFAPVVLRLLFIVLLLLLFAGILSAMSLKVLFVNVFSLFPFFLLIIRLVRFTEMYFVVCVTYA